MLLMILQRQRVHSIYDKPSPPYALPLDGCYRGLWGRRFPQVSAVHLTAVLDGRSRTCVSYSTRDANVGSVHSGKSPQTASRWPSDIRCSVVRIVLNNGSGSRHLRRARNNYPGRRIWLSIVSR